MASSTARAMLTVSDLDNWFKDVEGRFIKDPKFSNCFKDPRQLYNQDETPITWGTKHQKVLAVKGFSGPAYNLGGSSREHTTASVLVGADGSVPAVRIVWPGKRWSPAERDLQENIPADGVTGKFKFSKTPSGYVTREVFLEILSDLTDHITEHNVPRPVILVIDGFRGHLGLAISEYCDQNGIQLLLLRANMTHITQPLDVNIFGPVKSHTRALIHRWHSDNPGKTLNKFSHITEIARPAFEAALSKKETIIKAFEKTGIFPFNPAAANREKLKPGTIFQQGDSHVDNPVISTVDLLVDVVPAEEAPTDEISIIESVQLSQYEADIDEAEERSIVEQSRETDENSLSQPGCSHWPSTQYSAQAGPPPGPATIFRDCSAKVSSEADNHENNRSGDNVLCDLGFREDSLPVKRQKLERYQLFMLEPEQTAHFEDLFEKGHRFELNNYLWLSWLPLKLAAIGSEQEAFDLTLQDKLPNNLAKRTTKRKVKQPMGSARIDPQSQEYKEIFRETKEAEEKKKEMKNKTNVLKNIKKEKIAEQKKGRKRECDDAQDPPSAVPPPAKKRGRPKKSLAEDTSEQSLADVFTKKKR